MMMEPGMVEIKIDQLLELAKESARADLFRNGVKNKVPYNHILEIMDGNADELDQNANGRSMTLK